MIYSVYVLQSEMDHSYYIGQSANYKSRVWEHNHGNTNYTKKKRPWVLVYTEEYKTRGEAVKRERYLKRIKNKKYLEKIIKGEGP